MTQEEFTLGVSTVARHLATVGAGILAAKGIAGGDQLVAFGGAAAVFASAVGWSFIQKNSLLRQLCEGAPVSELEQLGAMIAKFRSQGSNPLLIANIANTAMAVAQQELLVAHPELAPKPQPETPPPAAAPSPPVGPVSVAADPQGGAQ